MKWERQYYNLSRGYSRYVCGEYTIKRTHSKNMFTGKEMSATYQLWEIFKGAEKIGYQHTLKDAKAFVEQISINGNK